MAYALSKRATEAGGIAASSSSQGLANLVETKLARWPKGRGKLGTGALWRKESWHRVFDTVFLDVRRGLGGGRLAFLRELEECGSYNEGVRLCRAVKWRRSTFA